VHASATDKGVRLEVSDGLGLAVVAGIVRRHGGNVSIQSDKARGTCVSLLLPGLVVEKS
jgi:signal transduction histidine kinase